MTSDHEKEIEAFGSNNDFWIFGYGLGKYMESRSAMTKGHREHVDNHSRASSEDHRGTPEAPGRVVTLIDKAHWETLNDQHDSASRVWGAAYHIPARHVQAVREYLDIREINGYSIQFTPFHPAVSNAKVTTLHDEPEGEHGHDLSSPPTGIKVTSTETVVPEPENIKCLVYIGLPENPQFLGPQDPDALARKILESKGPSGENREYLYNLEIALLGLSKDSGDAHVSDLVRRCKALEEQTGVKDGDEGEKDKEVLHKVGSTEEQEEVER
ncbi:Putative glutathione-specific gamma-glutamylcyclotransferase 2 [Curvularia clavata]|uniref:glutathione-specific gamma-glutamylcyclotransferase n=1 Tax=Curvularia clavata TaxID=95742 RepID=A0A9Q9DT41_CURCL|nr:Putative glutathione-specific gamma-glutamylcyclotransferase 2 [Curvularia clavata]